MLAPAETTRRAAAAAAAFAFGAYLFGYGIGVYSAVVSAMNGGVGGAVTAPKDIAVVILLTVIGLVLAGVALVLAGAVHHTVPIRRNGGVTARLSLPTTAAVIAAYALALAVSNLALEAMIARGWSLPDPDLVGTPIAVRVAESLNAGIGEEVIVLATLTAAVVALRVPAPLALSVLVLARMAYHLYYGWGVLAIGIWAVAVTLLWWRWRAPAILLGFIVLHTLFDVTLHWSMWLHWPEGTMRITALFGAPAVAVLAACAVHRYRTDRATLGTM